MKVLVRLLYLLFFLFTLTSCKKGINKPPIDLVEVEKTQKEVSKLDSKSEQKYNFSNFLDDFKKAVKNKDDEFIESNIKLPLEYTMTGESEIIKTYNDFKKSISIEYILESEPYNKTDNDSYDVTYSRSTDIGNGVEAYYGITFLFRKEDNKFYLFKIDEVEAI
ncbi:hypothetical protein [Aquimarina longa]|uniref:hypothetical protein n=1 Tax=Aquimarina longa TaxID=1080221 RepID=UPI00078259FD|nr:hypothetical protein [Aquimarina longa]